ncbi:TonB-dependent receptor [Sphingobium sp. JS3065]|uniref:TonB-dependent receptor n=1 Tax=Sphingobium sp. JS3065 TaxID=2970925 RepID=UPI00226524B7|nr:TonB-dependent receptor [Sphingobium sp. JS3065]UZW57257.1 TonB-dependent receptor [Sphingobium sp. JS3065]
MRRRSHIYSSCISYQEGSYMKTRAQRICALSISALSIGLTSPAWAQAAGSAQDLTGADAEHAATDIVVTAQRRAENLQKVPLAITALSADQLNSQGIETVADLGGKVPGLSVQKFNGIVQPFLRGIGSSTSTAGVESSVAVYLDGVYFSRLPSSFFDLANVERVEVLKGPQGTLFGRNSTGGVINVVTREPSFNPELKASIGYGRFDAVDGSMYVSSGLSDTVAMSASVTGKTSDGYGFNAITDNRYAFEDSLLINSKLMFKPSADSKVLLSGFYSWSENSGNKAAFPGTSSLGLNYYYDQILGLGLGVPRAGNVYGDNAPDARKLGFYESVSDPDQRDEFKVYGGSLKIEQNLGIATLVSISGYSHVSQNSSYGDYVPAPAPPAPIEFLVPAYSRVNLFTQELQLVSKRGSAFDWIFGLYYLNSKTSYTADTVFDIPLFYGDTPLTAPAAARVKSYAAYAQASYNVTPELKFTGGLRYTWDKTSGEGSQGGVVVVPPDTSKVHKPSYKVAVDYQVTPDVMVYALYSHGFKSGAYNILTYSSPATDPEELDDYEIGLKTELFDRRARFNVAAFWYDINNPQVQLITNGTTFLSNAGGARVKGAEADLTVRAAQGLNLRGSLSYLDAKYTDYTNAPAGRPNFVLGGSDVLPPIDASGNRLPFAAKWSFNLGGDYTIDTGVGAITLTADWFHNSGYTFEPDEFLRQGAYDLVNAQIKLQASDNLAVRFWGRNLLDKKIVAGAASQYGYAGYPWSPAPPLTYGMAFDFSF